MAKPKVIVDESYLISKNALVVAPTADAPTRSSETLRSLAFRVPEDVFFEFGDLARASRVRQVDYFLEMFAEHKSRRKAV